MTPTPIRGSQPLAASDAPPCPLVAILGATGAGKSPLALAAAEAFHGEVVNCDSLQVYRYFDIGTAKLPVAGRHGIPHHLIDIVDPDELFTAGEYARRARETVREISARGRLPIVCGGTGFYLRALLDGLFEGPSRDQNLRDRLAAHESRRPGSLHRLLSRFDPSAACKIHPRDVPKVMRAVEVCLLARRPVSELFRQGRNPLLGYRSLKIALRPGREALYERLNRRCRSMFESGLIDEVRRVLSLGFPVTVKPLQSHGYKQAVQYLSGELSFEQAIDSAQQNTRRYAKRQMTWFRHEPATEWMDGFGDHPATVEQALLRISQFLINPSPNPASG